MTQVYLAGPIAGLSYDEAANGWRNRISDLISLPIAVYSPMRNKEYLKNEDDLKNSGYTHPCSTNKGIVTRDRKDCCEADMMIVNLLGATRVSIGTMVEYGWADAHRVPIVTIMEKDGSNIHHHAFVLELSSFIVETIEEAADVANRILVEGI